MIIKFGTYYYDRMNKIILVQVDSYGRIEISNFEFLLINVILNVKLGGLVSG